MTSEGDKQGKSDSEPEYKKMGVMVGTVSAVFAVLTAIHTLTGFNPLKELFPEVKPTPSVTTMVLNSPTADASPTYRARRIVEDETTATTTTRPARHDFRVHSSQFDGPCGESWCSVSAVFRNVGGPGSGSATFYVLWPDRYAYLARCSVALPTTAENGFTSARCTASSVELQKYFRAYSSGVRLDVKVDG
jgi:hypothetical protein